MYVGSAILGILGLYIISKPKINPTIYVNFCLKTSNWKHQEYQTCQNQKLKIVIIYQSRSIEIKTAATHFAKKVETALLWTFSDFITFIARHYQVITTCQGMPPKVICRNASMNRPQSLPLTYPIHSTEDALAGGINTSPTAGFLRAYGMATICKKLDFHGVGSI